MQQIKTLTLLSILLISISCKKEYTCTCTIDRNGDISTEKEPLGKLSKKEAEEKCPNKSLF